MLTNHCSKCGKPSNYKVCSDCRKLKDKKYFQAHVASKSASAAQRKRELLDWYRKLKDGKYCQAGLQGCSGGPYHFSQLDFDHIPGRGIKKMDVSKMVRLGYEKEKIAQEIEKTELICKSCHGLRTWLRNHKKKVPNSYENAS